MTRNRSACRMCSIMSSLTRRSASVLRTRSRASAAIARERARSSGTSGLAADDLAAISDIATSLARDPGKWEPVFDRIGSRSALQVAPHNPDHVPGCRYAPSRYEAGSSWPGSSRHPRLTQKEDVDARDKRGHDAE